jgi:hypothetical protein
MIDHTQHRDVSACDRRVPVARVARIKPAGKLKREEAQNGATWQVRVRRGVKGEPTNGDGASTSTSRAHRRRARCTGFMQMQRIQASSPRAKTGNIGHKLCPAEILDDKLVL